MAHSLGAGKVNLLKVLGDHWQIGEKNDRRLNTAKSATLKDNFLKEGLHNCTMETAMPSAAKKDWIKSKLVANVDGLRMSDIEEIEWTVDGWEAFIAKLIHLLGGRHRIDAALAYLAMLSDDIEKLTSKIEALENPEGEVESKKKKGKGKEYDGPSPQTLRDEVTLLQGKAANAQWWVVYFYDLSE